MDKKKKMDKTGNHSIRKFLVEMSADNSSGARRISQSNTNVQERENHASLKKEKLHRNDYRNPLQERTNNISEEGPFNSFLQQSEEGKSHTFSFRYKYKKHAVACDMSKTVLDALNTNKIFEAIMGENKNKEIVIQRSQGDVPRAAVKRDFPCCLIEKDELLDISFIKNCGNVPTKRKTRRRSFSKETQNIVTFNIKTKGGKKVKRLMKNNELRKKVEDVCVYAFKEERIKDALRHDGRFINAIFKKHCALTEFGSETIYEMRQTVEHLDGKHFEIIVVSDSIQPESQDDFLGDEPYEACSADLQENIDPKQHPINNKQEVKSTNPNNSWTLEMIQDSEEIVRILRSQCPFYLESLVKQLGSRRKKSEVRKLLRAEYDKSVQSFSEVFKIKQIMRLSDSVCQIRAEGSARGSGFILFNRFIITNAHVVKDFMEDPNRFSSSKYLEAAFDFDRLDSKVKLVPIKKQIPAYCYITDANKRRLDFALLELDAADEISGRPELLSYYSPGVPSTGGVCIVGHPDGTNKKMDSCFIVAKDKAAEAADEHISKNVTFIHVVSQRCIEEKWDIYGNQFSYHSCFFYGSSGSPVFDEDCKLIGVHTGGYVYKEKRGKTRSVMEYGYTMQSILDMIRAQLKIKGLNEIVNLLENYSGVFETPEKEEETDCEMEDVE
ncbi:serine protease FAM111A [Danio aesculapii]|uniref:serine protease FAM111A n=1 Tax=Danio aesculapii TaxID=1142201 RepID=UPI0024C0997A|nr:serine protease FAM111A [Danio aesculapii]